VESGTQLTDEAQEWMDKKIKENPSLAKRMDVREQGEPVAPALALQRMRERHSECLGVLALASRVTQRRRGIRSQEVAECCKLGRGAHEGQVRSCIFSLP